RCRLLPSQQEPSIREGEFFGRKPRFLLNGARYKWDTPGSAATSTSRLHLGSISPTEGGRCFLAGAWPLTALANARGPGSPPPAYLCAGFRTCLRLSTHSRSTCRTSARTPTGQGLCRFRPVTTCWCEGEKES